MTFEPPKTIAHMQDITDTCSEEKFIEIVEAHKRYRQFVEKYKANPEAQSWVIIARGWIKDLYAINEKRFKVNYLDQ